MKEYKIIRLYINILSVVLFLCSAANVNSQSIYKTPSGKKYHLASCRMVENVSEKIDTEDISKYKLSACKICKPQKTVQISSNYDSSNKAVGESKTLQCKGKTQKNTRCKHKTSLANGYCYQHTKQNSSSNSYLPEINTQSSTCGAKTKSGGYCKRKVKGVRRCYQH